MTKSPEKKSVEKLFIKYQEAWIDGKAPEPEDYCRRHLEGEEVMRLQARIEEFLFMNRCLRLDAGKGRGRIAKACEEEKGTVSEALGDFRILREIGRGGMGVVYEAVQDSLNRTVALKVLPAHLTLREESVSRFQREAATAARLKHPGIVKIHAVGEEEGTHYFAMEFVEGAPLNRVIERIYQEATGSLTGEYLRSAVLSEKHVPTRNQDREQGRTDEGPWKKTFIETACRFVIQVADALDFAHESGVIHRDVKPSNILVREDASVVLTDFGLAREQDLPSLSITGEFAGTPHYIAPEQTLSGKTQVDHRVDIYSLGVTLFELLTLSKPFEGKTSQEILGKILSHEPPLPRGRNPQIPRDLETVCMTAMEKDPARRYGSAKEFSEDLRRFVEYRPIKARPVGITTRVFRMIRRNPAVSMAVCLAFLLLVAGPLVFGFQQKLANVRISKALEAKDKALKRAGEEADTATQVSDYLVKIFKVSMPSETRGKTVTAFEILQKGAESIEESLAERPIIRSRILETLGLAHKSLGLYVEAIPLFRQALDTHITELGEGHTTTLISKKNLGSVYLFLRRCDSAEPLLEKAYEGLLQQCGEEDERTLAVKSLLGMLYHQQNRLEEAELFYLQTLESRRRLLGEDHYITLESMNNLALLYKCQGRYDEAESLYQSTVEGCTRRMGDDHPDSLTALSNLSLLYDGWGRLEKAEELCRKALETRRRVLGDDHPDTLTSWNNLALLHKRAGRFDEAERLYLQVMENRREKLGEHHPDMLITKNNLAALYAEQDRFEEAGALLQQVFEDRCAILGEGHEETLVSLCNIAVLHAKQNRFDEAEPLFHRVLEERRRLFGEEHPDTIKTLSCLATLCTKQGRHEEAEALYKEILEVCRGQYSETHPLLPNILCNFAYLLAGLGRLDEAELLVREAVEVTDPASLNYSARKEFHESILQELEGKNNRRRAGSGRKR